MRKYRLVRLHGLKNYWGSVPVALPSKRVKDARHVARQDTVVGYRDAWKMVEIFPRATFAIIDMAGHSLSWEQEDLFNCLVSEWIQRVEGYVGD